MIVDYLFKVINNHSQDNLNGHSCNIFVHDLLLCHHLNNYAVFWLFWLYLDATRYYAIYRWRRLKQYGA
jgi:hypothetical protein